MVSGGWVRGVNGRLVPPAPGRGLVVPGRDVWREGLAQRSLGPRDRMEGQGESPEGWGLDGAFGRTGATVPRTEVVLTTHCNVE